MFNELTIQQLCALDYSRNMVVTSGPGAGKTRILSYRFCFILLTDDAITLPQILTLTFTEKAAEEMKGRIYDMLIGLDNNLKQHGNTALRNRIKTARDQFDKNRISTIHSFCANLLKEHPVEAGIDPHFSIVQGMRQKILLDDAIENAMAEIWETNRHELMPLLRSFGGRNNLFKAVRSLTENSSEFERVIKTSDRIFSIKGWEEQILSDYCVYLRDTLVIPYSEGLKTLEDKSETHAVLKDIFNDWESLWKDDHEYCGIPALFKKIRELSEQGERGRKKCSVDIGLKTLSYVDMADEHFPDIFINDNPDILFEKELRMFLNAVRLSIKKYNEEKEKINSLDFSDLETKSLSFLNRLLGDRDLSRLKKIQDRYRYIMVDEFQDTNRIQWDIIRTLCLDTGDKSYNSLLPGRIFVVGDKRQAIYRFRGGDVTVFESVNDEIKSSNTRPGPLFWHSENMSSRIMEFDQDFNPAEQNRRFEALSGAEQDKILKGDIYLPHNFRSDENPVAFFNRSFEEIFSNKHSGEIKNYETAPNDIHIPDHKKEAEEKGSVSIYIPGSDNGKAGQVETEAAFVARFIGSIMGKYGHDCPEYRAYGNIRKKLESNERAIGILFYAFTHVKTFENALRESGIPFVIHRGKGFYKSSEVIDLLQLLNYLTDERQEISLLGCLRGQIFGLSDPELFDLFYSRKSPTEALHASDNPYIKKIISQIESWRLLATRLPVTELIRTIMLQRSLTASYSVQPGGDQSLLNMEKLIDIARKFQKEDNGSLKEFVKYCLEMADGDEDEGEAVLASGAGSAVSLMTIHASKGLEFPMVIMPQLDRRAVLNPEQGRALRVFRSERKEPLEWNSTEGELPVWPVEMPAFEYRKKTGPLGHLLLNRNRLEEMAENRRVFYVGCSRAENHLVLVGTADEKKKDKDKKILTSQDYRLNANINQLLFDIYDADSEDSSKTDDKRYFPVITRYPVDIDSFQGIDYDPEKPDKASFGKYNYVIKKLDMSDPVRSSPYFQLSFTSIRIFMKCPARFYYNSVLKLREGELSSVPADEEQYEAAVSHENIEDYSSGDALFIGNFIHKYLEKHEFGAPFDSRLFEYVKKRIGSQECSIENCYNRAENLLRQTTEDRELNELLAGKPGYAEIPFLISAMPGIEFTGVMDRIFKDPATGLWTIIDWKSNDTVNKKPYQVIEESGYDIQLAFYKWALEKILDEKVDRQFIYFLDRGELVECSWKGNPEDILKDIIEKVSDFEMGSQWLKEYNTSGNSDPYCRFCGYHKTLCL